MKKTAILGSTGSIGTQALEVARAYPEDIRITALAAGRNVDMMEKQIREFSPSLAAMWEEAAAEDLKRRCADLPVRIVSGMEGLLEIAEQPESEMLLTAVVGMIGIRPTLQAIAAGKDIALANKETLVTAGHLIIPAVREAGVQLLPVDSEHNAIFQCSRGEERKAIRQILLTCSGGPFRGKKKEDLVNVRAADALKHPNWAMGAKITIDSATLVNKGLEVLEAAWLFGVTVDDVHVVVQPQSIVHSAVEYVDGSILAHLASPDMRLPIQYAFFYPERRPLALKPLDLAALGSITFEEPDGETFKGLPLAVKAGRIGGSMPTVFNAANEEAVRLFLEDRIRFLEIYECIEAAMEEHHVLEAPGLDAILETEKEARESVRRFCKN